MQKFASKFCDKILSALHGAFNIQYLWYEGLTNHDAITCDDVEWKSFLPLMQSKLHETTVESYTEIYTCWQEFWPMILLRLLGQKFTVLKSICLYINCAQMFLIYIQWFLIWCRKLSLPRFKVHIIWAHVLLIRAEAWIKVHWLYRLISGADTEAVRCGPKIISLGF